MSTTRSVFVGLVISLGALAGCVGTLSTGGGRPSGGDSGTTTGPLADMATNSDLTLGPPNACGDHDPGCTQSGFDPPQMSFPLGTDPNPNPNESDNGVERDPNGDLILGSTHSQFDFIYTANTDDWGRGTVSKMNSKQVKEVARYMSVTCLSNTGGTQAQCDGTNGCCTRDDYYRYQNRAAGQAPGMHQGVQLLNNWPSRTSVDFNGDVWVANRAFGGQSSVTKIANDLTECTERNGTPGIQTSSDVTGDGIINSDCNANGIPDDIADVQAKPCTNGMAQEFYGVDDECILFTTNTNVNMSIGRPLALGAGAVDFGPADAWAGSFNDAKFFRVDGTTGLIKVQTQMLDSQNGNAQANNPYGAAIDATGVLWSPGPGGGKLCYIDTNNPPGTGCVVNMPANLSFGYGVAMDRDQNVWVGGYPTPHAYRYTPDRTNGFSSLGNGFWTIFQNVGSGTGASGCQGRGIAADSRNANQYYVWMACHAVPYMVRIDGNTPVPKGADSYIDASMIPSIKVAGSTICGAGVDVEQNVWAVAQTGAIATRIMVDVNGNPTPPSTAGNPGTGCPVGAGDYCSTAVSGVDANTTSYTYSDFSGFGLRNFTLPKGTYSWVQSGCTDTNGNLVDTKWSKIIWDANVPANTTLTARARAGEVVPPDGTWGTYTGDFAVSPGDLTTQLMPMMSKYLQVEFDLTTQDKASTPTLKSFSIAYECPSGIM